ncbi:YeeE/YedE thiosulfate transporter family protein [Pelagicoccus enzymogenes]|uniref:YeeE/YedE family protein n=1 Tax=Pelagicoccus enzymogenes TaxID=2773457 RepID=UPI00280F3573|nr:YeeE/YedE thiosulfate transporter family protein [Pelagicoccus enzymogenes]MDQ8199586.1 YeeE/YedE thiosulfate transporter family protein [Pelagicoccus enzymogenes]
MDQYLSALLGGILLGAAALFLRLALGFPLGISGFLSKALSFKLEVAGWRLSFLAGMLATAVALAVFNPASISEPLSADLWLIAIAALLVGGGARIAGGCTSGHSLCGMGSLDLDSVVATLIFIASGALTVFFMEGFFA